MTRVLSCRCFVVPNVNLRGRDVFVDWAGGASLRAPRPSIFALQNRLTSHSVSMGLAVNNAPMSFKTDQTLRAKHLHTITNTTIHQLTPPQSQCHRTPSTLNGSTGSTSTGLYDPAASTEMATSTPPSTTSASPCDCCDSTTRLSTRSRHTCRWWSCFTEWAPSASWCCLREPSELSRPGTRSSETDWSVSWRSSLCAKQ